MFERILVPVNDSEHSWRALELAAKMADEFKSQTTLVHVYSVVPFLPVVQPGLHAPITSSEFVFEPPPSPATVEKMAEAPIEAGEKVLKKARQKLPERIKVETRVVEGDVAQEIIKIAEAEKFDLIIMGKRRMGKIRKFLEESISEEVINQVSIPVLIVK